MKLNAEPVESTVEDLRKQLEEESTGLNEDIEETERRLAAQGLGVRGSIDVSSEEDSLHGVFKCLVFTKLGNPARWRLAIEYGEEGMEEDGSINPLSSMSRRDRVILLGRVPELWQDMLRNAARHVLAVRNGRAKIQAFWATLDDSE